MRHRVRPSPFAITLHSLNGIASICSTSESSRLRVVQPARRGVLRNSRAGRPLLLRAPLRDGAVPMVTAHVLCRRAPLPPARSRLRAVRPTEELLLLQEARRKMEGHPVKVDAFGRERRVAATALDVAVCGPPVTSAAAPRAAAHARVSQLPTREAHVAM